MLPFHWWIVIGACAVAGMYDVTQHRIPNWLTAPLLVTGVCLAGMRIGWEGVGEHMLSCIILALPYVLLYTFAGGGAGDAKLMGALGAWLGLRSGITVLLTVAIAGIVLGIIFTLYGRRLRTALIHLKRMIMAAVLLFGRRGNGEEARWLLPAEQEMQTMPYGVAILAGVCVAAGGQLVCGL
jgi:prepilin peptidase CpaA